MVVSSSAKAIQHTPTVKVNLQTLVRAFQNFYSLLFFPPLSLSGMLLPEPLLKKKKNLGQ